jgi:putative flippase GtrA
MLIRARELETPCRQIPIATVYEAGNASSHFNPLLDSLRIYFVFLRFLVSSMLTAVIDIVVFSIAFRLGGSILAGAAVGRLVGGTFNFVVNERIVFKSEGPFWFELTKYAALVVSLMAISYQLILGFVENFDVNVYVAKISVETFLFLVSFTVQRVLVFGPGREKWAP